MNRRRFIGAATGFVLGMQYAFDLVREIPKPENPWMKILGVGNTQSWPDQMGPVMKVRIDKMFFLLPYFEEELRNAGNTFECNREFMNS